MSKKLSRNEKIGAWTVAVTSLFGLLLAALVLHRIIWTILTRPLFRMTDIGTKGRRGILVAVGLALITTSLHIEKFSELWGKIIEKFGG